MNPKTNAVLGKIRTTLETATQGKNLKGARLAEERDNQVTTEAKQRFVSEGLELIHAAGYELDGFDESTSAEEIQEAIAVVAEEEGESFGRKAETFLREFKY